MYSQTAEYALRAMACLATKPDQLVATPTLAKQTQVPPNYLAKVLQQLAGSNLISGRRGVGGGYKLARPASDISLLDVINAVSSVERLRRCPLGVQEHDATMCALHRRADQAIQAVIQIFGQSTLEDLLQDTQPNRPLCDIARGNDGEVAESKPTSVSASLQVSAHAGNNGHSSGPKGSSHAAGSAR